jgi:hypothetical protein
MGVHRGAYVLPLLPRDEGPAGPGGPLPLRRGGAGTGQPPPTRRRRPASPSWPASATRAPSPPRSAPSTIPPSGPRRSWPSSSQKPGPGSPPLPDGPGRAGAGAAPGGLALRIRPAAPGRRDPLFTFHVEQVVAKQHRGSDSPNNLALACHPDHLHKGPNRTGIDPKTNRLTRLFNPRRDKWGRHFYWDGALLVGKTPIGRATVVVLGMNLAHRVMLREKPTATGRFPPP